jgi:hypothetical protein
MPANPTPLPQDRPPGPVPQKEEEGDALRRERAFLAPRFIPLQPRPPAAAAAPPPPAPGPAGQPDDPFGRAQAFAAPRQAILQPRAPSVPPRAAEPVPGPPAAGTPAGPQPPEAAFRLRLMREYRRRSARPAGPPVFAPPVPPPHNNWVPIGPSGVRQGQAANRPIVSGRATGIAVAPGGQLVYVASANGGVWRSDDGGRAWRSLMDALDLKPTTLASDSLSCGAIALDPTNSQRVFVGSGEGDGAAYFGVGPIVSTDGGTNWKTELVADGDPPLAGSAFYALAVDPGDPDRVVAGTRQGTYRRQPDGAGSFRWARQAMGEPTWVTSVVAARRDGMTTFYGARWFGPVYTSADGAAWAPAGTDFPADNVGRIGLAVQPGNPDVVYALVTRGDGGMRGVWRLDAGDNRWRAVAEVPADLFGESRFQGSYDLAVAVDPEDADLLYLGGSTRLAGGQWSGALYRCRVARDGDGADRTYHTDPEYIGGNVHADIHVLRFTSGDRHTLWVGCDGGVFRADDADTAATFRSCNAGLATLTMNHLGAHPDEDAVLFCGTQDNGTTRYTGEEVWLHSGPGDGGYAVVNWREPLRVLRSYVTGTLYRATDGGQGYASWNDVSLPADYREDALFYGPLVGTPPNPDAPADADVVAFGGRRPWLSTTFGGAWRSLPDNAGSDDLPTRITALAFASATRLYVGTEVVESSPGVTVGGNVYRLDRQGDTWTRTQLDAAPLLRGPVTCIVVDPADPGGNSIYLTLGGRNDYRHAWHYDGTTWEARSGPADNADARLMDVQHNALVADPARPAQLYVGADIGVWRSPDGGRTWRRFADGLPDAAVLDLKLHPRRRLLWAATHGRGVYEYNVDADSARGVELYSRHTQLDRGRRPADDGLPDPAQPGAEVDHRRGPDLKVDPPDAAGGYQTPTNRLGFCDFVDALVDGSDRVATADPSGPPAVNRVYVQVHNRGVLAANGVRVLLLLAPAAGGPPDLPAGYADRVRAGQLIEAPPWRTVGEDRVSDVRVGFPQVAAIDLPSSLLPAPGSLAGNDTFCLLALLHSDEDAFTSTQTAVDPLTRTERKAVQKVIRVVAPAPAAASPPGTGGAPASAVSG